MTQHVYFSESIFEKYSYGYTGNMYEDGHWSIIWKGKKWWELTVQLPLGKYLNKM